MEINGDTPYVFDVDQILVDKVELFISCLELTEEYQDSTREEISDEVMRALLEWWVECEYAALSNLMDCLTEYAHDHSVERNIKAVEDIAKLEGREFVETRRIVKFFKQLLDDETDQISFERALLPTRGRVISITIARERL